MYKPRPITIRGCLTQSILTQTSENDLICSEKTHWQWTRRWKWGPSADKQACPQAMQQYTQDHIRGTYFSPIPQRHLWLLVSDILFTSKECCDLGVLHYLRPIHLISWIKIIKQTLYPGSNYKCIKLLLITIIITIVSSISQDGGNESRWIILAYQALPLQQVAQSFYLNGKSGVGSHFHSRHPIILKTNMRAFYTFVFTHSPFPFLFLLGLRFPFFPFLGGIIALMTASLMRGRMSLFLIPNHQNAHIF